MSLPLLAILFVIIAFIYASVGFSGGSAYLALLVLWQLPYTIIPAIALLCNVVVALGSSVRYVRSGYLNLKSLLPLVITSIPASYMGGRMEIERTVFMQILFWALLISGVRLLIQCRQYDDSSSSYKPISAIYSVVVGSVLGLLAGMTGIGGSVYLAPILYNLRAGSSKQIACTTSVFSLLNSLTGLIGQLHKHAFSNGIFVTYWYLPVLAFIGGQLGNLAMIKFISARVAALLTAVIVLFITVQLGVKILQ